MNILAHACLSGKEEGVILGNFIGDYIKGDPTHPRHGLSPDWQRGVWLHRRIDTFTDEHPVSAELRTVLHPYCHKYAGVALDILYDHFLALHFRQYTGTDLESFVNTFYTCLKDHSSQLPPPARRLADYMMRGNWLVGYRTREGISSALNGMARRTAFPSGLEKVADCLTANYAIFADGFALFFPALQRECVNWLRETSRAA